VKGGGFVCKQERYEREKGTAGIYSVENLYWKRFRYYTIEKSVFLTALDCT